MFDPRTPLARIRDSIVNRLITSNLHKALEHSQMGHLEDGRRHHRHAKRIAAKYAPDRLPEVHRVANNTDIPAHDLSTSANTNPTTRTVSHE